MKALPIIPAGLTLLAMIVIALVHSAHRLEMMYSAAITGVVTFACMTALVSIAKKDIATIVQGAHMITVAQMMVIGLAAVAVGLSGLVSDVTALAIWLIVFYWMELAVLAICAIRVIRKAAPAAGEKGSMGPMVKCL